MSANYGLNCDIVVTILKKRKQKNTFLFQTSQMDNGVIDADATRLDVGQKEMMGHIRVTAEYVKGQGTIEGGTAE